MPAWVIFLAVIVGTAQLCLGIRIGIRIGRLQQQRRRLIAVQRERGPTRAARRAAKWQECAAGVDDLNDRAQSLSSEAENYEPPLTDAFLAAITQLAEATAALQRQIHGAGKLFAPEAVASENETKPSPAAACEPGRQDAKGRATALSAAELLELANQPSHHAGQPIQQQRFPYVALQYMAPCGEHGMPASTDFQPVMCNDLSVNGISIIFKQAPAFEFAVISVGVLDDPIFVHCRVRYSRKVCVEGADRYLVGCEFIKRLPPGEFDWGQVSGQHAAVVG